MKKNAQDVKDVLILVLLYILFPQIIRNSQEFLQAGPKNGKQRKRSTSGGLSFVISKHIVKNKGIILRSDLD